VLSLAEQAEVAATDDEHMVRLIAEVFPEAASLATTPHALAGAGAGDSMKRSSGGGSAGAGAGAARSKPPTATRVTIALNELPPAPTVSLADVVVTQTPRVIHGHRRMPSTSSRFPSSPLVPTTPSSASAAGAGAAGAGAAGAGAVSAGAGAAGDDTLSIAPSTVDDTLAEVREWLRSVHRFNSLIATKHTAAGALCFC